MLPQVALQVFGGFPFNQQVCRREAVVYQHFDGYPLLPAGRQAQQGMIDAAEPARCNQHGGISLGADEIECGQGVVQRHGQPARAFEQDVIVTFGKYGGGAVDNGGGDTRSRHARGQMGRAGIAEQVGAGGAVGVFRQQRQVLQAAVDKDVVGDARAAGLYDFLGDDGKALLHQFGRQPAGGDGFADAGIDAADKQDFALLAGFEAV